MGRGHSREFLQLCNCRFQSECIVKEEQLAASARHSRGRLCYTILVKKPECGLQVRIPVRMRLLLQGAQEIQYVLFLCGSERVEVCNNRISF